MVWVLTVALLAVPLGGCVTTQPHRAKEPTVHDQPRVLLMPLQVLMLEAIASGMPVPKADWTRQAEGALVGGIEARLAEHGATLVRYRPEDGVVPYAAAHRPTVRLHQVVRATILTYRYNTSSRPDRRRPPKLVTKEGRFDWTLGESVRPLREDYDADYALFVAYRQANSSTGRSVLLGLGFLLYGLIAPTSQAIGIASLVDLHSGQLVWINALQGMTLDVGTPEGLHGRGRELLAGLPL